MASHKLKTEFIEQGTEIGSQIDSHFVRQTKDFIDKSFNVYKSAYDVPSNYSRDAFFKDHGWVGGATKNLYEGKLFKGFGKLAGAVVGGAALGGVLGRGLSENGKTKESMHAGINAGMAVGMASIFTSKMGRAKASLLSAAVGGKGSFMGRMMARMPYEHAGLAIGATSGFVIGRDEPESGVALGSLAGWGAGWAAGTVAMRSSGGSKKTSLLTSALKRIRR